MSTFKKVNNTFIQRKAIHYWANLVLNTSEMIYDDDFFAPIARFCNAKDVLDLLHAAFPQTELAKKIEKARVRKGSCQNYPELLQSVWNKTGGKKPIKKVLWTLAARADAQLACSKEDPLEQRFQEIQTTLALTDLELEILICAYLVSQNALSTNREISTNEIPVFYAMALNRSYGEISAALNANSKLRKYDILDSDLDYSECSIEEFLNSSGTIPLARQFYRIADEKPLPWSYFGELAKHDGLLLKQMLRPCHGKGKLNILLHGVPGSGKSSFARTLAHELKLKAYELPVTDEDGEPQGVASRLTAVQICSNLVDEGILIIDEADALLQHSGPMDLPFPMRMGRRSEKSAMNSVLDELKVPAIWICNTNLREIDPSVRRRFDYSIDFGPLTQEQRRLVWENCIRDLNAEDLFSKELVKEFAGKYETNAAGISLVIQNLKRMNPPKDKIKSLAETLLQNQCKRTTAKPPRKELEPDKNYSLEGLNVRGRIPLAKIEKAVGRFLKEDMSSSDSPRMSLLLWGPPGTGKTEFVKYLGKCHGTPVSILSASDFLNPLVGMTEHNIREAFAAASDKKTILFLDEVDSLLRNRQGAHQTWEVSQVNELLVQMEKFPGVLVGATNSLDQLDPAVLRRFTFKLQFDYLETPGKKVFFTRFFHTRLTKAEEQRLDGIDHLAPGDFRTVRQNLFYLDEEVTNQDRLDALEEEVRAKSTNGMHAVGF